MRWLGIDYGTRKLGLALSDPGGSMAFPRGVLEKLDNEQLYGDLLRLIREEGVEGLVVGLPLRLDGQESLTTRQARNFGNRLAARAGLEVCFVDERLTTAEAESLLREAGASGRKDVRDAQAAALILESHLAAQRDEAGQ
jgi:putative Holliday junction resolvase